MDTNVVELTKQFVQIESTSDNPKGLQHIVDVASALLSGWTIERFENAGVPSLLVYKAKKRPSTFKIILNGHLDVVPGKKHLYTPRIEGNQLYGVGALDMKASAACLISVFKDVADKVPYPLALQLVTDEEVGGFNGTNYQIKQGVKADFVIAGEPTNLNIVNKAKGIICLTVTFNGTTAHGAYPWKGVNAIWKANTFLNTLAEHFPIPTVESWVSTVNVAKIETSNSSFNKIPDDCTISLDIRFVPEESESILDKITACIPKDCDVQIILNEPPLSVPETNEYIQKIKHITEKIKKSQVRIYGAQGSSDARHFTRIGTNGIEFGPSGADIGADTEWVDISSLETYCEILKTFLLELK